MAFRRSLARLASASKTKLGPGPKSEPGPGPDAAAGERAGSTLVLDGVRRRLRRMLRKPAMVEPTPEQACRRLPSRVVAFEDRHGEGHACVVQQNFSAFGLERMPNDVRKVALGEPPKAAALRTLALLARCPELAEARWEDAVFFDTETTGLGGGTGNVAFVIGLLGCDHERGGYRSEHHFLAERSQEAAMLNRVAQRLDDASFWVSFNGKSYDWPLLKARFVMNRIRPPRQKPHLDLLHVARRVHRAEPFRKNLKRVEQEVLHFDRGPDLDGADVPERYFNYVLTGDGHRIDDVIHHNIVDVASLATLAALYANPLDYVRPAAIVAAADTLRRGAAYAQALDWLAVAASRDPSPEGHRIGGLIHRSLGNRSRAAADFEQALAWGEDPEMRLELAKIAEHHERDFERALGLLERQTSESAERHAHRRARLQRKIGCK